MQSVARAARLARPGLADHGDEFCAGCRAPGEFHRPGSTRLFATAAATTDSLSRMEACASRVLGRMNVRPT